MLEILSHQFLKKYLRSHSFDWDHIYSFGRILSKCIQNESTYLINSEIFYTQDWIVAVFISLFLHQEDSTFVLNSEKIRFFKHNQMEDLKNLGFKYILENDQLIFSSHRVRLVTLKDLLNDSNSLRLNNHRVVFSGIEEIKQDLKNNLRISLFKKDWFNQVRQSEHIYQNVINTYNFLKKKFFLRKSLGNCYLYLEKEELSFFVKFFNENAYFSEQFLRVSNALSQGWACWVKLDNTNFEWIFYLEPIDELSQIREFLTSNKFVFLSALRKDNFFQKYLKKQRLDVDLVVNFKSNFREKKISLYVPPKQMLPNNPLFNSEILDKCKKLTIFRKGLTLVLSDDVYLKKYLATELASVYGKRVYLETIESFENDILCASFDWWIKNSILVETPEQIIIPLLPIPSLSKPINLITVSYNKKLSKDWFREFLLPEAKVKLERSISPLRKNSGKLIILDGRANKRKWGRLLLQSIQPSKHINYMLPFD